MSKCKKILLSCCLMALLFCSVLPLSAFASSPLYFNFAEPYVSNNTGYIAFGLYNTNNASDTGMLFYYNITPKSNSSLEYMGDSPLFVLEDVYNNAFYFSIEGDTLTTYSFSFGIIHTDGTVQSLGCDTFTGTYSDGVIYFNSNLRIEYVDCHGNIDRSALDDDYPAFEYLFVDDKYDYLFLVSINSVLYDSLELNQQQLDKLVSIVSSNQHMSDMLDAIKTEFGSVLEQILEDNEEFQKTLDDIYKYQKLSYEQLIYFYDEFITWMTIIDDDLANIWFSVDDLENNTDELEGLLKQILDALTPEAEVNISKVDTSNLDSYLDAEHSLIDDENLDVSEAIKVEIDQQALVIIWDKLQSILNTHPQVFGFVITVLSISVVALILGRGN